ncbi:MAG: amidohydrolase family protein, partial [Planctomycetaceae bacterium]
VSPAANIPLELLHNDMQEYGVDRAVIVQPIYPGEDNLLISDSAALDPEHLASVCVVDPRQNDAPARLEHWVRNHGCRGLRLRPRIQAESECFGHPSTYALWETAAQLQVVVSVMGGFEHLSALGELAHRFEQVSIVVDHLAHPPLDDPSQLDPLLRLAENPNVFLKVSGLPYDSKQPYPYTDCIPVVRTIHKRFGPQRLVWGSDFPHVLLQCGYARILRWFERTCPNLNDSDLEHMLGGNACRLYWNNA